VESGEGIESRHARDRPRQSQQVESGEGIERSISSRLTTQVAHGRLWNPVKELKAGRGLGKAGRGEQLVESGEGIESRASA